jgi:hypothetical protein
MPIFAEEGLKVTLTAAAGRLPSPMAVMAIRRIPIDEKTDPTAWFSRNILATALIILGHLCPEFPIFRGV